MADGSPTAELRGVTKRFGDALAVNRLDLEIQRGELFSMLGPSGCGKTTTLRMLGGFMVPDEGKILLDGTDVTGVPPYRRDVNTVFQSYALFAHLTVAENIAFGLRRRRVDKAEIRQRVGAMLDLVALADRANAKPVELSGGQQQRVALARALVNRPKLLLLDEPLGALDLKLRRQMQVELKQIQREVGITFIFVTHDQEEALTLSDRIAVMDGGVVQQCGTPMEIYERPANGFVASFIGTSNLLAGTLRDGAVALGCGPAVPLLDGRRNGCADGDEVLLSVRPERLLLDGEPVPGGPSLEATVTEVVYLGSSTQVVLDAAGERLVASSARQGGVPAIDVRRGDRVRVAWHPEDTIVLPRTAAGHAASSPSTLSPQERA